MKKTGIKYILLMDGDGQEVTVNGWIRTERHSKGISFLEINDGSTIKNLQVIIEENFPDYESIVKHANTGCSVSVTGNLIPSPAKGQKVELKASAIKIIGESPPDYV
ncbi:MAG: asparagine--tRNA ligase, partial [Deltaproteobacteria bacterium]|nr:asparagine--tRNA ligase [Deltaproteobacteria bacterium]